MTSASTVPADQTTTSGLREDPDWFRTAVFYEVLVRAFADSTGSGNGDFVGLIDKLDYLHWLGVDCLWIPPFYASPLRDGGYDIADYRSVLPEFGTIEDFRELVAQAHARGIRIITDFVMNHTSDAHPWFQASRSDPDGPYGDYYVWSDTDTKYAGTRIIFVDTESSNWSFDVVRRQHERGTIGRGRLQQLRGDLPAGARPVFDDDVLPEALGEMRRQQPRERVGGSARRERDDEPDRGLEGLGGNARRQAGGREGRGEGVPVPVRIRPRCIPASVRPAISHHAHHRRIRVRAPQTRRQRACAARARRHRSRHRAKHTPAFRQIIRTAHGGADRPAFC